ncbi:MAG: hypothetical protein H9534_04710 [Dolichospermum circinale Clear-D4]|nr:hypothetical protein [Dolichospermum circinale Clear-D4]
MRLGKVLIGCGIKSVIAITIGASLFGLKQAEAQSIPACRNIQPRSGQVCYTEHPFSARQRDEGGTKNWSFIVERVAPNYVIVDYQILIDRSFGASSKPTGSIVSAKGNASIIQESTRQEEKLGETRSQLKGKIQGCYPPVCGQLQGQIDRIDREVEKLSDTRRTAVSAGGNEKIQFTYTTSVSCKKYLGSKICGSGAAMDGKVRVNQRYLGDPNLLRQESLSLVEQSRFLLQQASKPSPPNSPPPYVQPKTCFSVDSRQGWQSFTANHRVASVNYIEGGWSVDARLYSSVGYKGHEGADAERLSPFNAYKSNQSFPFGALLMELPNGEVIWANNPGGELGSFPANSTFRFRINDEALGDNGGSLKVCLVYGVG